MAKVLGGLVQESRMMCRREVKIVGRSVINGNVTSVRCEMGFDGARWDKGGFRD